MAVGFTRNKKYYYGGIYSDLEEAKKALVKLKEQVPSKDIL